MEFTNSFCTFLVDLVSAALGGKKEDEVGLDDGEGTEDMTEEQKANLIAVLGEHDFYLNYPHLKED